LRLLGIVLLIPGLFRVPLPQADYHNVRHHHGAGEVCPHHDHLLRWHPTANRNDDVALLHWHWFVPQSDPSTPRSGNGDEQHDPRSGPGLHAYLADGLKPDWDGDPVIRLDGRGRFLQHITSGFSSLDVSAELLPLNLAPPHLGLIHASNSRAPLRPRAGLFGLFQRWNC
jgi:hypothetical protein